jgi:hypothetical protein
MNMSTVRLAIISCFIILKTSAQPAPAQRVFTSDIDHFWIAYDSVQTTRDSLQQVRFIQTLYVDRGSPGLKAFMQVRNFSVAEWVGLLRRYPKFWRSVRPNTLIVNSQASEIEASITKFNRLYPDLSNSQMYFTIGCLRSGGTVKDSLVLIASEIAAADSLTDVSEFETQWLAGVFRTQNIQNIVPLNIHEYVHTQQKFRGSSNLLGGALAEGSCEFITELVMGKPRQTQAILYGKEHEKELKAAFAAEMFSTATPTRWLSNGSYAEKVADLGYFMGYTICGAYYRRAVDKQQAIRDIIQLDYTDTVATEKFLLRSGYLTGPFDKAALSAALDKKIPAVIGITPISNGDTTVDPSLKELTIQFSLPLADKGFELDPGAKGKDFFPVLQGAVLSSDKRSLTLQLALLPDREYNFAVVFISPGRYLPNPYSVSFKTRSRH